MPEAVSTEWTSFRGGNAGANWAQERAYQGLGAGLAGAGVLAHRVFVEAAQHFAVSPLVKNPVFCGVACGLLHAVGPDHLGTVMALSSLNTPAKGFRLGASWGLGHSAGMILICLLYFPIRRLFPHAKFQDLEEIGDYLVGFSMIACGAYFLLAAKWYLERKPDGHVGLRSCHCCRPRGEGTSETDFMCTEEVQPLIMQPGQEGGVVSRKRNSLLMRPGSKNWKPYGAVLLEGPRADGGAAPKAGDEAKAPLEKPGAPRSEEDEPENTKKKKNEEAAADRTAAKKVLTAAAVLSRAVAEEDEHSRGDHQLVKVEGGVATRLEAPEHEKGMMMNFMGSSDTGGGSTSSLIASMLQPRNVGSGLLGLFQGVCCPAGLVGVGFLGRIGAEHAMALFLFLLVFVVVSSVGMGLLAAGWAQLTRQGFAEIVSISAIYYASAIFTLSLGVLWVGLCYTHKLDALEMDARVVVGVGVGEAAEVPA